MTAVSGREAQAAPAMRRARPEAGVPVVLFAYRRPRHLTRALDSLRTNAIPFLIVYCDGAKTDDDAASVSKVREIVREIDWCDKRVIERQTNMGLGDSVRLGVTDVLAEFGSAIIFEDDIVCTPGAYRYLCNALEYFESETRVMSVAAHNYPPASPGGVGPEGYLDGRFMCWGWGTWQRAWEGMHLSAPDLLWECKLRLRNVNRYGADIPAMAVAESQKNLWAVRFCLLHFLRRGLCFHPPVGLTRNIGFGDDATNTKGEARRHGEEAAPVAPVFVPPGVPLREAAQVGELWRNAVGTPKKMAMSLRLQYLAWSVRPVSAALLRACGRLLATGHLDP